MQPHSQQSPDDSALQQSLVSMTFGRCIAMIIGIPVLVAFLNVLANLWLVSVVDERYVTLWTGTPSAIVALVVGIMAWRRGYRRTAMLGVVVWFVPAFLFAWFTAAFWNG